MLHATYVKYVITMHPISLVVKIWLASIGNKLRREIYEPFAWQ